MDVEIIQEINLVSSSDYNITIGFFPTRNSNYFYDPYFKVYNHKREASATKVARIYLNRAEYVSEHNNRDGKKSFKLNKNELAFMLKCLRDSCTIKDINNNRIRFYSAYEAMCWKITEIARNIGINVDYTNQQMPDYTLLL